MEETGYKLKLAKSESDFEAARRLFLEYADYIGMDLSFQNFDDELRVIAGHYSKHLGGIILLIDAAKDDAVGCVALRRFEGGVAELKRMYIKESYRGRGPGDRLMERAIALAREFGYQKIRLDSIEEMTEALSLYKKFGFKEMEAYRYNPLAGAVFLELDL
ncbi:MAG: GNAT family N-acetyltransferase [Actinomycetota bacterium]|nr:GNAT family N-acetyltransferase [Actinomycetota bacterium]